MERRLEINKQLDELEKSYCNRNRGSIYYSRKTHLIEALEHNTRKAMELGTKGNMVIICGTYKLRVCGVDPIVPFPPIVAQLVEQEDCNLFFINMSKEDAERLAKWKYPEFKITKIVEFNSLGKIISNQEFSILTRK
jgi:hypothetical protein